MVELVNNHDAEVVCREACEVGCIQALNRCKDVVERCRPASADPLLTKIRISQRVPECCLTLIEDFLAVCDE